MTNIKNPSISITLFSPERLLCWPRRSVSTKRASLWNTSWPLSTSSPVLYRTPTAEQAEQVTALNITSSAPHTNSWTSGTPGRPQHHHQLCTTLQQLNKWCNWLPSTSSVLHHTPTEQVKQLTTLNITSSAPHTNWTTSEATDYLQHHQFCTTPQLNNKWSNWLPSTSSVLHHTPTEQQVKQLTTFNIISSAPHPNWTTSEATDYLQHHQFCTTPQLNNKWSNWLPSTSSVLHHTPTEQQVKQLTTFNIISSAPHPNWTTSEATDYLQHHRFCTTPQLNNKWSNWLPSTSSVLHRTPTEQVKQLTTLKIITSSAPHTSSQTSGTPGHPQHHHQLCTAHQQLNNKWKNGLPSTSSPVLHQTPTTTHIVEQLLVTFNVIVMSSGQHANYTTCKHYLLD